jgi:cell fate regulator YaaT (PSP1 superfamily)
MVQTDAFGVMGLRYKELSMWVVKKNYISEIATHISEENNHQKEDGHLNLKLILENRNGKELNIWESIYIKQRYKNLNHTLLNIDDGP